MITVFTTNTCALRECDKPRRANKLCNTHNMRKHRGKDPEQTTTSDRRPAVIKDGLVHLQLNHHARNGYALVDMKYKHLEEYPWTLNSNGYPITTVDGKQVYLHKLIMKNTTSIIDHKNRNKLDNRVTNLRAVSHRDNILNSGLPKNNNSGYRGVYKNGKFWVANIHRFGKTYFLGQSVNIGEAIALRKTAELKYGFAK